MRLAADANVLLSCVLGGRAKLILESPRVTEILTVEQVLDEVEEYACLLARRKRLADDLVLLAIGALPITLVERDEYVGSLSEASRRIGGREPDDVELLALAIGFKIPIWSNDRDFKDTGIEWYTTESLLRQLRIISSP